MPITYYGLFGVLRLDRRLSNIMYEPSPPVYLPRTPPGPPASPPRAHREPPVLSGDMIDREKTPVE